jgi:hypothetical protein
MGVSAALAIGIGATPAHGAFPYARSGADLSDPTDLYLTDTVPSDLCDDANEWKLSASADPNNGPQVNSNPVELNGVRGAHVVDKDPPGEDCSNPPLAASDKPTAWKLTTGRPDVTISVLDSGIKWNDAGAMGDLRFKLRLNRGELPLPQETGGTDCAVYDCNGDGVFNLADYADDPRVNDVVQNSANRAGPGGMMTPQDLIIAFSDTSDADSNGYVDDIAGWDFLDNDNDPFDDVQYGHGTGEASDSSSEADNGRQVGTCPNCTFIPLRVGDSFVADVNRFAAAALYATDNGVDVVQEALGTLNNSRLSRQAVNYAYRHGVTVIASAADEAAQHNNWPSSLPHVILVNSVTNSPVPAVNKSYLDFNGCTNFNAKITLAIPSTSCSSNATGLAAGMAGLVYSAALNAKAKGALPDYPDQGQCERVNGDPCVITPNEVRQVMATGKTDGTEVADDVNFAGTPPGGTEPSCSPVPLPGCTDPNAALQTQVNLDRPPLVPGVLQSYPARKGPDQFYGYGRVNMAKAVAAVISDPESPAATHLPPEAEITSPEWYERIDPANPTLDVEGQTFARGATYSCTLEVAPGQYPNNAQAPDGDFTVVPGGWCNGSSHTEDHSGSLGQINVTQLKGLFPPATDFTGAEPQASNADGNGRPNPAPHAFTIRLTVSSTQGGVDLEGADRRAAYLHHDADMLPGFPRPVTPGATGTGDGESSPAFADLDGDNRNELIYGSSDGFVHAVEPDGTELSGWPVRGEKPGIVGQHQASHAYQSGEVGSDLGGAILASIAVGDADGDGLQEVFAADMEGKVYGWSAEGERVFTEESDPKFSGKPLQPFENVREGQTNRTQHGFIGSPVLADLDGDGVQELIAAGMDRHVYAWRTADSNPSQPGGASDLPGFPVLVVDPTKVQSIDSETHQVTFIPDSGSDQQGAIVDTPAVADLDGDGDPEIVVGTNEEYAADQDGGWNAAPANTASVNLLDQVRQAIQEPNDACGGCLDDANTIDPANTRLYAIYSDGDAHQGDADAFLPGWPAKMAILLKGLLPVVGEGVTGYPVIADVDCGQGDGPKVGAIPNNGAAYIFSPNGESCYGQADGKDIPLQSDGYESESGTPPAANGDHPMLAAVGLPAFGDLEGTGPSFLAPTAGVMRALDLVFPEYQPTGQDFLSAWTPPAGGQLHPQFPQAVNDLQFITGPSVADIDGLPGEEAIEGTASMDLNAFTAAGVEVPGWPKLTGDWTVANPLVGTFGTLDTDADVHKVVVAMTRSGDISAYSTGAEACSPSSWPRFHHDNANSGYYSRDAMLPGKPIQMLVASGQVSFKAPGDDLLCGTADHYEIRTSDQPIDESNFAEADALTDPPIPAAPGASQAYAVPESVKRYVAVRAVDEQGNVGRVASVDYLGPPPPPVPCSNVLRGTPGNDDLTGTNQSDRIRGRGGDDTLHGRGGDDCESGGGDRDVVVGNKGDDKLRGGIGRDGIQGNQGDDTIKAADGHPDRVFCGPGDDTVFADPEDRLRGCETVN